MTLEYIRNDYRNHEYTRKRIRKLSLSTIAKIVQTRALDGTAPRDVERMNDVLGDSIPSIEFKFEAGNRISDIRQELNNDRPCIAWINVVNLPDELWHGIVITGYDPVRNTLSYNNPDALTPHIGYSEMEIGRFNERWDNRGMLVKVIIGKRIQRKIPSFLGDSQS